MSIIKFQMPILLIKEIFRRRGNECSEVNECLFAKLRSLWCDSGGGGDWEGMALTWLWIVPRSGSEIIETESESYLLQPLNKCFRGDNFWTKQN
jgi:hypothetical protein